jgi:RNA polymerase sigma-70 factor (ECF subfamily)
MPKEENEMAGRYPDIHMNEICRDTWKELFRFNYYRVQNREEAEDITQETYERALIYLKKKDTKILEYSVFLKTISMNIIKDRWRSKKRRGSSVNIEDIDPEAIAAEDFTDTVADQAVVKKAMERLTKDQQTVIRLRIIEGFSAAETARIMNKKESTVRVLQHRAIKALAEILNVTNQKEESR